MAIEDGIRTYERARLLVERRRNRGIGCNRRLFFDFDPEPRIFLRSGLTAHHKPIHRTPRREARNCAKTYYSSGGTQNVSPNFRYKDLRPSQPVGKVNLNNLIVRVDVHPTIFFILR